MIAYSDRPLPPETAAALAAWQSEVDGAADYSASVAAAKALFGARNTRQNPTFRVVRRTLDEMCAGPRRCMYCEDSVADEVEHFRPKDLYPEVVFAWHNYLYACGPCNGPKNNRFMVLDTAGNPVEVTRPRGAPIVPPVSGSPLLIDPRTEDPMPLLRLDLEGTFYFLPTAQSPSLAYARATYTIDLLGLNERDYLPNARRGAYRHYREMLRGYADGRDAGESRPRLEERRKDLRITGHPTVWEEMKRQRAGHPELAALFERAPEALGW